MLRFQGVHQPGELLDCGTWVYRAKVDPDHAAERLHLQLVHCADICQHEVALLQMVQTQIVQPVHGLAQAKRFVRAQKKLTHELAASLSLFMCLFDLQVLLDVLAHDETALLD